MSIKIRKATLTDQLQLKSLYLAVATLPGGLAREANEITDFFVHSLIQDSLDSGLILIAESRTDQRIIAAIHATHSNAINLNHVMGGLTILVHPLFQTQGIGKFIFSQFLKTIAAEYSFIMRVELRARASNEFALKLYENLGFREEGRFISRIKKANGDFEDGVAMAWFNPKFQQKVQQRLVEQAIEI